MLAAGKTRKIVARVSIALAAIVAFALGSASPAAAYSVGHSGWGVVCARGFCVPSGIMTHIVDGRGVQLSYDRVEWSSAGNICNWWVDFDYYDTRNVSYRHIQGGAHYECGRNRNVRVDFSPYLNYGFRAGRACATLYSNSVRVTSQCHSLY